MGLIYKTYEVSGNRSTVPVNALFDTCAGPSFLRQDIAESIGTPAALPQPQRFTLADGTVALTVDRSINIAFTIGDAPLFYNFLVVDNLAEEMIIGADMMQRWKISLDLDQESVTVDHRALRLRA